jgi:hypothetical protein
LKKSIKTIKLLFSFSRKATAPKKELPPPPPPPKAPKQKD